MDTTTNDKNMKADGSLEQKDAKRPKLCQENLQETPQERTTPTKIFNNKHCHIQTLTTSDQHVNLLLTHSNDDVFNIDGKGEGTVRSILKFTVIPFHRDVLGCNPVVLPNEDALDNNPFSSDVPMDRRDDASNLILSFLRSYDFQLTSESGGEYSFYKGIPTPTTDMQSLIADLLKKLSTMIVSNENKDSEPKSTTLSPLVASFGCFNVELISPASDRQVSRFMPSHSSALIEETPLMYDKVTKPMIQNIVDGSSLGWIKNIIEGKKEKERLLMNTDSFILNIDTKWRSHPDPFTIPRDEWFKHKATADLYCLGFLKEEGVASIRDLTSKHIPVLRSLLNQGCETIEKVYGVSKDQLRVFVHYQPQFYHFHVHFTRLENDIGTQVERAHLLVDIVQNLESDPEFYKKRTITYKLQKTNLLYKEIVAFQQESEE